MDGEDLSPLELLARDQHRFVWDGILERSDHLICGLRVCLQAGYAVRLSTVGYGTVLRVSLTDARGWQAGWVVESGRDLATLFGALSDTEGLRFAETRLEPPRGRSGRR